MITLLDPLFWLNFLLFCLAVFLAFFVPGDLALSKLKLSVFQRISLGTIVGMVFWAWQGFIFGYSHLRFLTYIYFILLFLLWLFRLNKKKKSKEKRVKTPFKEKIDFILVLLVGLGIFIQLAPVWGFGLEYSKGLFLCCGNRDDFLFHGALTGAIVKNIPPVEPGMNGVLVSNYHYWSNLVVAELIRVFHLPLLATQFQYTPLFISSFLGLVVIVFARLLAISRAFTRWLIFLMYFGGDIIFLFLLALGKGLDKVRLVSSLEDGSTFLINPPRAFSIVIAFAAFSLFYLGIKEKKKSASFLAIFLLASTVGFKVYTGIFALMGVSCLLIFFLWKKRFQQVAISALFFPISAIIYFSTNAASGGLFWAPFHLSNNFIVQPTFGLIRWEMARQVFLEHRNLLRVLQYELIFAAIFLITLSGTKLIAFFQPLGSLFRLGKELAFFLVVGMLGSLFIGLFFLQKTGGANTFNFVVSFWVFLSIPAALALDFWQKRIPLRLQLLFVVFVALLTLPRVAVNTYSNVSEYLKFGYYFITNDELSAFTFLKNETDKEAVIIVDPAYGPDLSGPAVGLFTNRPMYLSGKGILDSHGIATEKLALVKKDIFKSNNSLLLANHLADNKIDYILLWEKDILLATESATFTKNVFHNNAFSIVQIDSDLAIKFLKDHKQ